MKKWEVSLISGLLLAIFTSNLALFAKQVEQLRSCTLRLHVMANSDTPGDQALKNSVRDAVLEAYGDVFADAVDKTSALDNARQLLGSIRNTAIEEIRRRGYNHDVSVEIVNMGFSTTKYDSFTMPAGNYDAVRITIGAGDGKNWWCVLFPPMCLPAAGTDVKYDPAQMALISDTQYIPKFAVIEFFENIKRTLIGNKPA